MKAVELRQLSDAELQARLDETKAELMNLRFQSASGQLEDNNRMRIVKRDVARVMTIMTERAMEAEHAQ